nr:GGDEF domain-containing protein [uncultured Lichenicoccus sp.]
MNDTFGHDIGDAVLTTVAQRLATIAGVQPVARMGGDEFVMLFGDGRGDDSAAISERIVADVSRPVDWNGVQAELGVSVGIASSPQDGGRPVEPLRTADKAMYVAKQSAGVWNDRRSRSLLAPA